MAITRSGQVHHGLDPAARGVVPRGVGVIEAECEITVTGNEEPIERIDGRVGGPGEHVGLAGRSLIPAELGEPLDREAGVRCVES